MLRGVRESAVLVAAALLALSAGSARAQAPAGAEARPPRPVDERAVRRSLDAADTDLKRFEEQLVFVEKEYTRKDETSQARAVRKFSEGEIQFLLKDWLHCAIALYDAIDVPEFQASPDYATAIYYLAESLYQQGNYPSARTYFREVLARRDPRNYQQALVRSLDLTIKLGSYEGVDELINAAQTVFAGQIPPELLYLSAKATFKRTDLPLAERIRRGQEAFAKVPPPYQSAAAYFTGVLFVQAQAYSSALENFERCTKYTPTDARQRDVRELCFLALGRLYYENGRYSEAIDRYQEVGRESPHFNESLYEIAWSFVAAKEYEKALRATELLLLVAGESTIAPEASILRGHLFLKLGKYPEALETYNTVINTYAPVRDEVDAILGGHADPVAYFNDLVSKSDRGFDVASILPPVAVKWASTQHEVGDAIRVVGDIDSGRRGVQEGKEIAGRIDAVLDRNSGLDAFPSLREGYARAEAIENGLARIDGELLAAETELTGRDMSAQVKSELDTIRKEVEVLREQIRTVPQTPEQVDQRRERMRARLAAMEKSAFQLGYELEACKAQIAASQKWLDDHRAEISTKTDPQEQAKFVEQLKNQRDVVGNFETELVQVRKDIAKEGDAIGGPTPAEEELRKGLERKQARERELLAGARANANGFAQDQLRRVDQMRERIGVLLTRASGVKQNMKGQARGRADDIRKQVQVQRDLLDAYLKSMSGVQGDARDLVGRIAFTSFKQVRHQFYQLVLKADVGIVDVAWTRKRERLDKIQQLSGQKAKDLGQLDDDFKGVLKEVQ
jgi:tetratricopeptide (TPR) repeat protein